MKVRKAVIAAAGYGTRFLPATKTIPKEMLPLIDKPTIQILVEELVDSGIWDIIIVVRAGQHALEDHFDSNVELEQMLQQTGKTEYLEITKKPTNLANFVFIRQNRDLPYGNGTPLLCLKNLIGKNEPFIYAFGDDLVKSAVPCTKQLLDVYYKNSDAAAVFAIQEVPKEEVERYGIVKLKKGTENEVEDIIEKPSINEAPSRLAEFGRFIFDHRIIEVLQRQELGKGGELWLIDAIRELAKKEKVLAARVKGKWMTTGDPLRMLKTTIDYALDRDDLGPPLREYLRKLKL
jgi:UTP--glucose-1-phosphate uridylyltransferase